MLTLSCIVSVRAIHDDHNAAGFIVFQTGEKIWSQEKAPAIKKKLQISAYASETNLGKMFSMGQTVVRHF